MIFKGDTVRLQCHFKSFEGQSVNPVEVTLTIYNIDETKIESINLNDTNQHDIGVFYYDYVFPEDKDEIVFEFKGLHNDNPIIVRDKVKATFN